MLVAKQVADLITAGRVLIAVLLGWLGITQGTGALPEAVWLMIADWTGDFMDGRIARRSRIHYHSWIGDHDLQVDMIVALGLLVFLLGSGLAPAWLAMVYLFVWTAYFYRVGIQKAMGMLFQAPVYAWFIGGALLLEPQTGRWIVIWIVAVIAMTWPKFPNEVIPDFLNGMRRLRRN
jgi:phosphatidylglycerophosphate synthase